MGARRFRGSGSWWSAVSAAAALAVGAGLLLTAAGCPDEQPRKNRNDPAGQSAGGSGSGPGGGSSSGAQSGPGGATAGAQGSPGSGGVSGVGVPGGVPGAVPVGGDLPLLPSVEPGPQEKYDLAMLDALNLLAQNKLPEALAAFESARAVMDTEQVRGEIEKVRASISRQAAGEQTVRDIAAVIQQGRPQEAARLAGESLSAFGETPVGTQVVELKRQADALAAAQLPDDSARYDRFRAEGDAALKESNFRAAAVAYETALQYRRDDALLKTYSDLQGRLNAYDENRRQAAALRADPARLEDALAALEQARQAYDTLQLRQEIDECRLALSKRRDRISVADFEVRGDVGIPLAGRTVADELLPAFRGRFDVLERGQLDRVLGELKLNGSDLAANDAGRREVGRLARLRYLVLGSITRVGGAVLVNARVVEVASGLVVQTGKAVARSPEELIGLMPALAANLMRPDETVGPVAVGGPQGQPVGQPVGQPQPQPVPQPIPQPDVIAPGIPVLPPPPPPADFPQGQPVPLPPPPPDPSAQVPPPPPVVTVDPRPIAIGEVNPDLFNRLPTVPNGGVPTVPAAPPQGDDRFRAIMLQVVLELADNMFSRGRPADAMRQYELAQQLYPDRPEIHARIERCRPLIPPPAPVVVAPPPPVVIGVPLPPPQGGPVLPPPPVVVVQRPRAAILNFVVVGDPAVVPPWLSQESPRYLAPYFDPPFEVVPTEEVAWWMGRLGLTLRDLLVNPDARRWLGRAVNVQFFVLGEVRQTASFNVGVKVLGSEDGFVHQAGGMHFRNVREFRQRSGELARLTMTPPQQQAALNQSADQMEGLLDTAGKLLNGGKLDERDVGTALSALTQALNLRPDSERARLLQGRALERQRQIQLEQARQAEEARRRQLWEAERQRQLDIARQAEAARIESERLAAAQAAAAAQAQAAEQQRREAERDFAYRRLMAAGRLSLQRGDLPSAIQSFDGAARLRPTDEAVAALSQARARQAEQETARAAEAERQRRAAETARRVAEFEAARRAAEQERLRRAAEEKALADAIAARQEAEFRELLDRARASHAAGNYADELAALREARRRRRTPEVEAMIGRALADQARAEKSAADLARYQEAERARQAAEAEAAARRAEYQRLVNAAAAAYNAGRIDEALRDYRAADGLFPNTDAVLGGIRSCEAVRSRRAAEAERARREAEQREARAREVAASIAAGQAALQSGKLPEARAAFEAAARLEPGSVEAQGGLSRVELAEQAARAEADRRGRFARVKGLIEQARADLKAGQFNSAVDGANAALQIDPGNRQAAALLTEAKAARDAAAAAAAADAKAKAELAARQVAYEQAMRDGRFSLELKDYAAAQKAADRALALFPGDRSATALAAEARGAKSAAEAALAAETKRRQEEAARAAAASRTVGQARSSLAGGRFDEAAKLAEEAARLNPAEPSLPALRDDIARARAAADAEARAAAARQREYAALMQAGKDALSAGDPDKAAQSFAAAGRLVPGDKEADRWLRTALRTKTAADSKAAEAKAKADADAKAKADADARARLEAEARAKAEADAKAKADADAKAAQAVRVADYQAKMNAGRQALTAGNFDEAVRQFQAAQAVFPGDKNSAALLERAQRGKAEADAKLKADADLKARQAAEAKAKADAEAKLKAEAELKARLDAEARAKAEADAKAKADADAKAAQAAKVADYQGKMAAGRQALTAGNFDEAIRQFQAAQAVFPGDKNSAAFLERAQRGKAEADAKLKADADAKAKADADLKARQAAEAKAKADADLKVRLDAEAKAKADADAKAAQAAKVADYQGKMAAGRQALTAGNFDEAIRQFQAAQAVFPGDKNSAALLDQAVKGKQAAESKAKADADAKAKADADLKARQAAEAKAKADAEAKAKADAEAKTKADADTKAAKVGDYQAKMAAGRQALTAGNFDEAIRQFTAAQAVFPGDKNSAALLERAQRAKADADAGKAPPKTPQPKGQPQPQPKVPVLPPPPPPPPSPEAYNAAVAKVRAAIKAADWAGGRTAVAEMEKLSPNDPTTAAVRNEFNEAYRVAERNWYIATAEANFSARKYREAAKFASDGLKNHPNEPKLTELLRVSNFNIHFEAGNELMKAGKPAEAIPQFEAALRFGPTDKAAQSALEAARKAAGK
jgi:tetratricopeptide (TPR) repeat protein